jgi:excinuclease ABC subunit C
MSASKQDVAGYQARTAQCRGQSAATRGRPFSGPPRARPHDPGQEGAKIHVVKVRPPTGSIPDAPGSYQFLDADGRVLYVGKAKSLRHRLPSYWQDPAALPPRTAQMVAQAERVEWVVVETEVDALILEHSLIQGHKPRFNVRLKDDKSYPWLAITVNEEWPRPAVVRGRRRKGVRYFGPYGHVGALRDTLDLLLRSFPVRTCSDTKFKRHQRLGRPCLLFDIERCSGPCVGAVEHDRYDGMVEDLSRFLSGETAPVIKGLETEMAAAAEALEFERAARLRDRLVAVHKAAETQQMVSERPEDLDVIGIADDELEAAVQVFHVRRGRVVGRHGFIADKVEDLSGAQFVSRVVEELYGRGIEVPRRVLVPGPADEADVLTQWLVALRGGPVQLAVPQRGSKRALQEMVTRNAREDLARHRLRRASDHNSRSKALTELQSALGLAQAPLRIECYDMSHLQGTDYVGSMVVFEDGLAKKSDYRKFAVKTVAGNDDYAAMEEVLTRRLSRLVAERAENAQRSGREVGDQQLGARPVRRRFAYPPQLLLLDGGKGQLAVGERVLASLGLSEEIEVAALAKQFEEVYRPGRDEPIRIPRGSEALYLLQGLRDEAHRFAIGFHRQRRGSRMTVSALDGVPGLGPARRARLLKEFGGNRALRVAPIEALLALPWLPDPVAHGVFEHLHNPAPRPPARR